MNGRGTSIVGAVHYGTPSFAAPAPSVWMVSAKTASDHPHTTPPGALGPENPRRRLETPVRASGRRVQAPGPGLDYKAQPQSAPMS
jgi:hypothetical protein